MARKIPVVSWIIKHSPNRDPKFHHVEMLEGVGRSISELFMILIKGWLVRKGLFISLNDVKDLLEKM